MNLIHECYKRSTARSTFLEDVLCDGQRGENAGPTGVERELRKDFRGLRLRKAVIHRPVEVGKLRKLTGRYQGADL